MDKQEMEFDGIRLSIPGDGSNENRQMQNPSSEGKDVPPPDKSAEAEKEIQIKSESKPSDPFPVTETVVPVPAAESDDPVPDDIRLAEVETDAGKICSDPDAAENIPENIPEDEEIKIIPSVENTDNKKHNKADAETGKKRKKRSGQIAVPEMKKRHYKLSCFMFLLVAGGLIYGGYYYYSKHELQVKKWLRSGERVMYSFRMDSLGKSDIEEKDAVGRTRLLFAAAANEMDELGRLVKKKANVLHQDERDNGLFHYAVESDNPEMIKWIGTRAKKWKLNINLQNKDGDTPLHCAVRNGNVEVIKQFIILRAGRKIKNKDGKTAIQLTDDDGIKKLFGKK